MWKKIKDNLDSGIERLRWFAALFNDRVKIEISLVKFLYQASELEKKRADFLKTIGERVLELKNNPEKQILRDETILRTVEEVEKLEAEIEDLREKASDISRVD